MTENASNPTQVRPSTLYYVRLAMVEARSLLSLAVPLILGLAASTLIGVTDTIMIAPLGTNALGAVSLTMSVSIAFYAAIYGLVSMIGVSIAAAHGADDRTATAVLFRSGLVLGTIVGIGGALLMAGLLLLLPLFGQPTQVLAILPGYWLTMAVFLIPYAMMLVLKALFDAIDRPWTGVVFALLGVAINVPLNYVLINGVGAWSGLGLTGAGLASLLAEGMAVAMALLYLRYARWLAHIRLVGASRAALAAQLREGAPVSFGYFAETTAYAFAGVMVGWFGAVALAANQIVGSISAVLYMLPLGMAAAVAIRIAQAAGAGENTRLRPIAGAAFAIVTLWMLIVTAVVTAEGDTIAGWLGADPAVIQLGATLFVIIGLMQVADGLQSTALGALRGLGDTRLPMLVTLVAYWLIALPLAYVVGVTFGLGSAGVWIGYGAGLFVAALYLPVRFFQITQRIVLPQSPSA
jgi:MATE family multidrug resistance protein